MESGLNTQFTLREDVILIIKKRMCVSDIDELRKQIMDEAQTAPYAMHPGSTKLYQDLKPFY